MAKTRAGRGQIQENLEIAGTRGIKIPSGTTAQRNGSPQEGEIRYNTELNLFEGYANGVWASMGPFPSTFVDTFYGDGSTYEFVLSAGVPNADYLIVTVNGVTLTKNLDWRLLDGNILSFTEDDSTVNAPLSDAEITVRGFSPVTTASVASGSIGLSELAFSDGTTGQVLTTNGSGTLSFQDIPTQDPTLGGDFLQGTAGAAVVQSNSITIEQLAVSDGTLGQVLATDGSGNLSFISVSGGTGGAAVTNFFDLTGQIAFSQIPDNLINIAKLDVSDGTNGQVLTTDGAGNLSFQDTPAGETNTASNLGGGEGVFAQKSTADLQFKSLAAGTGVSLSSTATEITISSSFNTFSNIAVSGQTTLEADSSTDTLTIAAGTGISISTAGPSDTLTITNSSPNQSQNLWATITADSGNTTANTTTDTLNVVGGTDISTSISGDTLTIAFTGSGGGAANQNAFSNIEVSGQSTVSADAETDTLTLVAGSGINIITDAASDTITLSVAGSAGSGTINGGTAGRLAYYATTGTTLSETSADLTWNNSTGNLTVGGTLSADALESTGVGVPTFTSSSDIVLDAASGSGEVQITGDLVVSGTISGSSIEHTFNIVNNGVSDYTFSDDNNHWFPTSENDPILYLRRGETYIFNVNASGHPFEIRVSNGGAAYSTGVTNNGAQVGNVVFKVPMSAPSTLYYQCQLHSAMGNTINIV